MKMIALISVLFTGLCFGQDFDHSTVKTKNIQCFSVSPSVVMVKHPHGANITCIAIEEGLIFVDCGLDTETASKFRKDMESRFNKSAKYLFVTHAHIDHFLGMKAFSDLEVIAARAGEPVWKRFVNLKWTEPAIKSMTRIFPSFPQSLKTAKMFLPTRWFERDLIIKDGKSQVVITLHGGHSNDSSSLYFPREGVLVCGDLVQVDQYPYFGDTGNHFPSWLKAFSAWLKLPVKKICPGHGRVVNLEYVSKMKNYFETLIEQVGKLKKSGVPVKEVVTHKTLPKPYWPEDVPRPAWFSYCIAQLFQKTKI
jgi:glyoxylase-like metal-dependent hydrolase (beta-lactamase superfamily II)